MVDSITISSEDEFIDAVAGVDEDPFDRDEERAECYKLWTQFVDEKGPYVLVMLPNWFADNEFGIRRPVLFAIVEHDDSDSGAVLFSNAEMVNISVIDNLALDKLGMDAAFDELDISDDDDYIDESGKMWIPRSLMQIFELA